MSNEIHEMNLDLLDKFAYTQEITFHANIVAGIFRRKRLIAVGVNSEKTHPLAKKFQKRDGCIFLHAEIDAIKNALKEINQDELSKCTLYVCRHKKNHTWGLAKPCSGCQRAIATFGVGEVVYTTNNQGEYEVI